MKKISTLFKKDPNDLGRVINEINPENQWVFDGEGIPTRKLDGTACAIINGELYKRYDVKKGKQVPEGAIPCQEPDAITEHWPHWVKCDRSNPADKYHFQSADTLFLRTPSTYSPKHGLIYSQKMDGTYELCGPKIQGNPEGFEEHLLIRHGSEIIEVNDYSFYGIKVLLESMDIEGIVFHHKTDGRMCKIRKSDFGIKRVSKKGGVEL